MAARDVTILIKAVDRASKTLNTVSKAGTSAFRSMRTGVIGLTAALAAAGYAYTKLITSGIRYNAELEKFNAILTTVLGTQQLANEEMQRAIKFAAETPFQIPQIVEATARLEMFGISAQDNLRWIGDMAAATGNDIMRATEALILAMMGQFKRLEAFGIKKQLLVPFGLMLDAQGAITDMDSVLFALKGFAEKFEGQMDVMSTTFIGLMSNLKDQWAGILGVLAKPIFEKLKIEIRALLDQITRMKQTGRLEEVLRGWADAGKELARIFSDFVRGAGRDFLNLIQSSGDAVAYFLSTLDSERISIWIDQLVAFASAVAKSTAFVIKLIAQNWKLIAAFGALTIISTMTLKVIAFGKAVIALTTFLGPVGLLFALAGIVTFLMNSYVPSMDEALRKTQEVLDLAARAGEYFEIVQAMKAVQDQIELVNKAEQGIMNQRKSAIRGQRGLAKWEQENNQELINLANERVNLELTLNDLEKEKRSLLGKEVPLADEIPEQEITTALVKEVKVREDLREEEMLNEVKAIQNAQIAILNARGETWKAEELRAHIRAFEILQDTGDVIKANQFLATELSRIEAGITQDKIDQKQLVRDFENEHAMFIKLRDEEIAREKLEQEEKLARKRAEESEREQQRIEADRKLFANAQRRNLQDAERTFQAQAAMYQVYAGYAMDAEAAISMAVDKRYGALAGHILRVITQLVGQNKIQLAHEKYIQASQFKTHGEYMAQKAVEAGILSLMAFASGNLAAGTAYAVAAGSAATASAAALTAFATKQTSARASLAQGIGIQTAGELGAAALGGIGGGGGSNRVVVNQTNTFNGIVESNSKEQLREWAELLSPYMEDVEKKAEA